MVRSTLFTVGFAIVFFVAGPLGYSQLVHPQWKIMLLFFLTISLLIHRLMEAGFQNNRANFIPFYMASTIARFLLSAGFVGFFYSGTSGSVVCSLSSFLYYIYVIRVLKSSDWGVTCDAIDENRICSGYASVNYS